MSREAMTLALEALELLARYEHPETKIQVRKKNGGPIVTVYPHKVSSDAAQALRAALDAPEPEPVFNCPRCGHCCPQPAAWVGLTDQEIEDFWNHFEPRFDYYLFSRAIEAKLKERNT